MNFVPAEARSGSGRDAVVGLPGGHEMHLTTRNGLAKPGNIEVGIRPEHVKLGAPDDPGASLGGKVQILERLGNATIMYVDTPAGQIVVQDDGDVTTKAGDTVSVIFDPSRVHAFAADSAAI
jgi:ABC-type sugar transport system ATPase subunit